MPILTGTPGGDRLIYRHAPTHVTALLDGHPPLAASDFIVI